MPLNSDYDIGAAFRVIEEELIASMMRNMKRHFQETQLDMDWTAWQAEQLYALDQYKRRTEKKYGKEFYHLNERMEELIRQANASGRMDQELEILEAIRKGMDLHRQKGAALRFFKVNDRKLNALIKATRADMEKAETAVLRMSQDRYRQIIFNAQVYANTGAGTYEKAVDMATKDFMMAGLNCVEYKNGARHTLSDYADMAIRTASKRAYLQGEGEMRQEWGIHTVIINKRSDNPCPKCLPFVGKVMIDDVWSGGSRKDGDYPLMSEAVAAGLYHPRCKDSHTTYFPGISTPPDDKYTKEEVEEIRKDAEQEAEQQQAMHEAERFKRFADTRLDPENKKAAEARAEEWQKRAEQINNSAKISRSQETISKDDYPVPGELISAEDLKKFSDAVRERGFRFSDKASGLQKPKFGGFEQYRGSVDKLYEILDELEKTREYWPRRLKKKGILIGYQDFGNIKDFGECQGRTIFYNKRIYDDSSFLERAYEEAVKDGTFVRGTTAKAVSWHEIGHVLQHTNDVYYHRMRMQIFRLCEKKTDEEFLKKALSLTSNYGITMDEDGYLNELICELLSATTSSEDDIRDNALAIIQEVFK